MEFNRKQAIEKALEHMAIGEQIAKQREEKINSQEQEIVILRYYKGKTQTEVAKKLGISQVQVSRIEKRILYSMKQKLVI